MVIILLILGHCSINDSSFEYKRVCAQAMSGSLECDGYHRFHKEENLPLLVELKEVFL